MEYRGVPSPFVVAFSASMNSYRAITDAPSRRRPRLLPGIPSPASTLGSRAPARAAAPAPTRSTAPHPADAPFRRLSPNSGASRHQHHYHELPLPAIYATAPP